MPKTLRKRKTRIHKIADNTLQLLKCVAEASAWTANVFPTSKSMWRSILSPFSSEMEAERDRTREIVEQKRLLKSLKKARLLVERKTAGDLEYALTHKGLEAVLREQMRQEDRLLKDQVCIVTFDIPESERHTRKFFRSFLKTVGFFQVQKSVWATDKDVANRMAQFIKLAKAEKWINLFLATPLVINKIHKKYKNKRGRAKSQYVRVS